jgi:hypothetical protein
MLAGDGIVMREQAEQIKVLRSAIENLVSVKGRHHTELAYLRCVEALEETK